MAPNETTIAVPTIRRTIVFSDPAYLSTSAEDTPYQWLKLCDEAGKSCKTLLDVRGAGGVSMPADKTLGLSPDGRYLLAFRMAGVDAPGKSYRTQYYELYDLSAGTRVTFNTSAGLTATTDNIQGWSAGRPHALDVSAGSGKIDQAWPPGEN